MFMNGNLAIYQVLCFMLATQANMVFQAYVRPFETPNENVMDIYNESVVLWVAYHHLVMLSYALDTD